jgi:hypothetical protein
MMPNQEQLFSALRTLLAFGAGIAVAHGLITETQATQIVGAIVVLAPLIWGMLAQTNFAKVMAAAQVPGVARVVVKQDAPASLLDAAADQSHPNVQPEAKK